MKTTCNQRHNKLFLTTLTGMSVALALVLDKLNAETDSRAESLLTSLAIDTLPPLVMLSELSDAEATALTTIQPGDTPPPSSTWLTAIHEYLDAGTRAEATPSIDDDLSITSPVLTPNLFEHPKTETLEPIINVALNAPMNVLDEAEDPAQHTAAEAASSGMPTYVWYIIGGVAAAGIITAVVLAVTAATPAQAMAVAVVRQATPITSSGIKIKIRNMTKVRIFSGNPTQHKKTMKGPHP